MSDQLCKRTIEHIIGVLEAGAQGAEQNIHDANAGRIGASAIRLQITVLRDLYQPDELAKQNGE